MYDYYRDCEPPLFCVNSQCVTVTFLILLKLFHLFLGSGILHATIINECNVQNVTSEKGGEKRGQNQI